MNSPAAAVDMHLTEKSEAFLSVLIFEALTARVSEPQQLKRNFNTSKFDDRFRAEFFLEQSNDCFIPENVDTELTAAIIENSSPEATQKKKKKKFYNSSSSINNIYTYLKQNTHKLK